MDENLLSLLEELSLRSCSEDESSKLDSAYLSSNYTSSCNTSPNYESSSSNSIEEDVELKNAVNSLFSELETKNPNPNESHTTSSTNPSLRSNNRGIDKSKLLVALLGNIDLVTKSVKKINQLVSLGKRMERIYRFYYADHNAPLDLEEIKRLIIAFREIYETESYVREVNVSRLYQAYCVKLEQIYTARAQSGDNHNILMPNLMEPNSTSTVHIASNTDQDMMSC